MTFTQSALNSTSNDDTVDIVPSLLVLLMADA